MFRPPYTAPVTQQFSPLALPSLKEARDIARKSIISDSDSLLDFFRIANYSCCLNLFRTNTVLKNLSRKPGRLQILDLNLARSTY